MSTQTDNATRELLDAAGNPGGLEAVFGQYKNSKGPFYHALAQATSELRQQVEELSKKKASLQAECGRLQDQSNSKAAQCTEIDKRVKVSTQQLSQAQTSLSQIQGLLDEAHGLKKLGFTEQHLAQLRELLTQLATSSGAKPKETIDQFFRHVSSYQELVSLQEEAGRVRSLASKAKAETDRWQAEAKAAEARCKARKTTIDLTERLVALGVKEQDIPSWVAILNSAGISPEGLADTLTKYASLHELCNSRKQLVAKLDSQVMGLNAQVKALSQERQKVSEVIQAIREEALAEVHQAGQEVLMGLRNLEARFQEYGALREQVGDLKAETTLARALRSGDPEVWRGIGPQGAYTLLNAVLMWARSREFNPQLPATEVIQRWSSSIYQKVRFGDLVAWAMSGLPEAERSNKSQRQMPQGDKEPATTKATLVARRVS